MRESGRERLLGQFCYAKELLVFNILYSPVLVLWSIPGDLSTTGPGLGPAPLTHIVKSCGMKENFLPGFVSDHKYQVIYQITNTVLSPSFIFFFLIQSLSDLPVGCLWTLGDVVCARTTPRALLCCQAPGRRFWEVQVGPGSQAGFASPSLLSGLRTHPPHGKLSLKISTSFQRLVLIAALLLISKPQE